MASRHDFQQIVALAQRHFLQAPVAQHQQVGFSQLLKSARGSAVAAEQVGELAFTEPPRVSVVDILQVVL